MTVPVAENLRTAAKNRPGLGDVILRRWNNEAADLLDAIDALTGDYVRATDGAHAQHPEWEPDPIVRGFAHACREVQRLLHPAPKEDNPCETCGGTGERSIIHGDGAWNIWPCPSCRGSEPT